MTESGAIQRSLFSDVLPTRITRKEAGAYYTPHPVVASLVSWAVRNETDNLLDPACGDGRFIAAHQHSVGIEQDENAARVAAQRAPAAVVHHFDFFEWAGRTTERFECASGNPPFIRYQTFKGMTRARALALCSRMGVAFSGLSSSWAPFLVATASLLKPGGRLAFVVPAEIGHAPYAAPLLDYLVDHFSKVHLVAVREKLFPELSEDCWLLHADGFGGRTPSIRFTITDRFAPSTQPPEAFVAVDVREWRENWNRRLRPFLIGDAGRSLYQEVVRNADSRRFGAFASIGIGYVSGANDFFHLRQSDAERWGIPAALLHPSVRSGRVLRASKLTTDVVDCWRLNDEPMLLLRLSKFDDLPRSVMRYLESDAGRVAREAYKCRVRDPWYSVPDVQVPDFFLSYMSGREPSLVRNEAGCTCTNSVHAVRIKEGDAAVQKYLAAWGSPFVQLSCEIEGHPLGGGMLKLEPREAARIVLPPVKALRRLDTTVLTDAIETMRTWRHYAPRA